MSDFQIRLLVVTGVVLVTIVITSLLRARSGRPMRRINAVGLDPGTYFFSSAGCAECESARELLIEHLGHKGFMEFRWEDDPDPFDRYGVGGVPATLVVEGAGSGRLWQGSPSQMISDLDP